MRNPFIAVSITFLLGIVCASCIQLPGVSSYAFFIAAGIIAALFFKVLDNNPIAHICLFLLIFLAGSVHFISWNTFPADHIKNIVSTGADNISLKGVIVDDPVFKRKYGYLPEIRFLLKIRALKMTDKYIPSSGLVLVEAYFPGDQIYQYGDRLELNGRIETPRPPKTKSSFDYKRYLERKHIYVLCKVGKGQSIKIIDDRMNMYTKLRRHLFLIKRKMSNNLLIHIKPPYSNILVAMLLGERHYLSRPIKKIFADTGTMHILAISGLHVGILVFVFFAFFKIIHFTGKGAHVTMIILTFLYALMIGGRASVWRAAIMVSIFLFGISINRRVHLSNVVGLSLIVLLLINPNYIYDIGFILSFVCVGAIAWISPVLDGLFRLNRPVEMDNPKPRKTNILYYGIKTFSVSLSVWISVIPLTAYWFNIITPGTIIANIFVVPVCFALIVVSIIALIFSVVVPYVSFILYDAVWFLCFVLVDCLKVFSKIPGVFFLVKNFPIWLIPVYYILLTAIIIFAKKTIVTNKSIRL